MLMEFATTIPGNVNFELGFSGVKGFTLLAPTAILRPYFGLKKLKITALNNHCTVWAKKRFEENLTIVRPSPELSYHC